MDRFVIISGCSGGGKSALIDELDSRGFQTIDEPGRRLVKHQLASNGKALPWLDEVLFLRQLVYVARSDYGAARLLTGKWVFFDRGLIDAASALQHVTGEQTLRSSERFHPIVFMAPPWPENFTTDNERRHGFDDAVAEYERLTKYYPALGYQVVSLPMVSVAERANFVLKTLA